MASEKKITIFSGSATLILGMPLVTGHLTMSIVSQHGVAWSQVFTYDPASKIIDTDRMKLSEVVLSHGNGIGPILGGVMFVSDLIIGLVSALAAIVRGGLGGFVGIGLFGIAFVLLLAFIGLMLSAYAFLTIAPLLILSYALRSAKRTRLRQEEEAISKEAAALFSQASSPVTSPMLAPQA